MRAARTRAIVLGAAVLGWLATPWAAVAEVGGLHLNVTPFGGYTDWDEDVNLDKKGYYGGRLGLMFGGHFGVEGYYGWITTQTLSGNGDSLFVATPASQSPPTDVDVQKYGADVVLNILPGFVLNPFLLGGWHEEKIKPDGTATETFMNGLEFGGGVKLGLGSRVALRLEARDKLWSFDSNQAPDPPGDVSQHNIFYSGGLQISLGGSAEGDLDRDGVSDSKDRCADTPAGALVDANGCPLDADGDSVADGIDQCPNTPSGATVDARGCPSDSDSDGVPDGIDQCASTPAGTPVDARGCTLDADRDGVPDNADQCANTPSGATVDARGCPTDADSDGVPDGIDQCPNTAAGASVDARGCPTDSDNDGVMDNQDKCPNTQANVRVDSDGCPIELTEREVELLDKGRITARNINFESAKWDILPESQPILDEIGRILIQWPQLRIEIGGHADSRGSEAYNLELTQKRAQAVLDYLVTNFPQINKDQYTARGYGETKPIASNETVQGRARNRRVEFKVLNTEELRKEKERRRLLKKGE